MIKPRYPGITLKMNYPVVSRYFEHSLPISSGASILWYYYHLAPLPRHHSSVCSSPAIKTESVPPPPSPVIKTVAVSVPPPSSKRCLSPPPPSSRWCLFLPRHHSGVCPPLSVITAVSVPPASSQRCLFLPRHHSGVCSFTPPAHLAGVRLGGRRAGAGRTGNVRLPPRTLCPLQRRPGRQLPEVRRVQSVHHAGAQSLFVGCRCSASGYRCPASSCRCSASSSRCSASGCKCPASDCRCSASGYRCLVSGCRCSASGCRCPVPWLQVFSALVAGVLVAGAWCLLQVSSIWLHVPSVRLQVPWLQVSSLWLQVSWLQVSGLWLQVPWLQVPGVWLQVLAAADGGEAYRAGAVRWPTVARREARELQRGGEEAATRLRRRLQRHLWLPVHEAVQETREWVDDVDSRHCHAVAVNNGLTAQWLDRWHLVG